MTWLTDPHAEQILRGLYPEQYPGWWKVRLRYGFVVLLAGIATGGTFLKMRPSSLRFGVVTGPRIGPAISGERLHHEAQTENSLHDQDQQPDNHNLH
jgi:hypothetical protein